MKGQIVDASIVKILIQCSIDVKHTFIRGWKVTDPSVHDSNVFEEILAENTNRNVWVDSAYYWKDRLKSLEKCGYRELIHRKGTRSRKLTAREHKSNRTKSKIRVRVEHVFGVQIQKAGHLLIS